MLKIGILPGDDIGPEVVPEAVKVMTAAARATGLEIHWSPLSIGRSAHETHGHTVPKSTIEALKGLDGWILGPMGHDSYPRNDPTWTSAGLRKRFDLFAGVKPVRSYPNIKSVHQNVDMVILRELTEGLQSNAVVVAGSGEFRPNDDISIGMRVITRRGANRVAREAFRIARTRPRKKVTAVHKEPTYKLCCGMFAEECRKVAAEFPDVKLEEVLIDGMAMKIAISPQQFDVVVTTNVFGDILSDEGAAVVGGLGLAPGLCVGERQAMAQATHGSAPDIAGQGIANPFAMIESGRMLLEWLGHHHGQVEAVQAAKRMDKAMVDVIAAGKDLTRDLGGSASTSRMGDAVVAALCAPSADHREGVRP